MTGVDLDDVGAALRVIERALDRPAEAYLAVPVDPDRFTRAHRVAIPAHTEGYGLLLAGVLRAAVERGYCAEPAIADGVLYLCLRPAPREVDLLWPARSFVTACPFDGHGWIRHVRAGTGLLLRAQTDPQRRIDRRAMAAVLPDEDPLTQALRSALARARSGMLTA